jgi:hypothetical protein
MAQANAHDGKVVASIVSLNRNLQEYFDTLREMSWPMVFGPQLGFTAWDQQTVDMREELSQGRRIGIVGNRYNPTMIETPILGPRLLQEVNV